MEALKDILLEEPQLLKDLLQDVFSELSSSIELTQINQAMDKKRITDLELLMGLRGEKPGDLDEDEIQRISELRKKSTLVKNIQIEPQESDEEKLYKELKHTPSMKNKDVINFLGFDKKDSMKANRLMKKVAIRDDVVYEPISGKKRGFRIHLRD